MNKKIENNTVQIIGEIASPFTYNHEVFGESFYSVIVKTKRLSSTEDLVPVIISERLFDTTQDLTGLQIEVVGNFRSYNLHIGNKNRLILSVFAREARLLEAFKDGCNIIELEGFICKPPIYRETPLGRQIADILIAVNRPYGKSDYIPCVLWGRNALMCESLNVSDCINVTGRIQSREYQKKISETEIETHTTYEVSVSRVTVL